MSELWPKKHPIISGIVITAFGSIFFKEPREFLASLLVGVWNILINCYHWVGSAVGVPVWLVIILCILSIGSLGWIAARCFEKKDLPPFLKYRKDFIKGVNWRWDWGSCGVEGLTPYCPNCDMCLTYIEPRIYDHDSGTSFYCDQCERIVANIKGGGMDYARSVVLREIDRKVRNNLFRVSQE